MWVLRGNATESGDVGGSPKKSSLFFLTPIAHKSSDRKMKSTLKRELNSTWNCWKGSVVTRLAPLRSSGVLTGALGAAQASIGFGGGIKVRLLLQPRSASSSRLSLDFPDLPGKPAYTLKPGQPSPGQHSLLRPPFASLSTFDVWVLAKHGCNG